MTEEKKVHKPLDVEVGDLVALKPEAIRDVPHLKPVQLFKIRWPNMFGILDVVDDPEKGQLLTLDPCCYNMLHDEDDAEHSCAAHSSKYFKKIPGRFLNFEQTKKERTGRYASVEVGGEEVFASEDRNGKDRLFVVKFPGGHVVRATESMLEDLFKKIKGGK